MTQLTTSSAAFDLPVVVRDVRFEKERSVRFYRNPATSELNIQTDDTKSVIKIVNSYGAEVYYGTIADGKLDILRLPNGVYTVISIVNGKPETKRFLKK